MSKLNKDFLLTTLLVAIIIILFLLNIEKAKPIEIEGPDNILFNKSTNTLYFNSLTLEQKIAQMIIAYGKEDNKAILQKMFIGGIFLEAASSKDDFIRIINEFQNNTVVPFFIASDMEGCINPFESFQDFPALKEIETKEQAYKVGYDEGRLLKELGFNINFAPVVDLEDNIWGCRNFVGTPEDISKKAVYYIRGLLDNGIIATSKHYPGKTLSTKDPHKFIIYESIDKESLLPFKETIKNNVSAIMVSHIIVDGLVNSESKPSVVSQRLVNDLRDKFIGLIITDEIRMLGLKDYYTNIDQMYIDLFKADNDLILNFDRDPKNVYYMISVVKDAVKEGKISEDRIDRSVTRILDFKGINVIK